MSTVLQTLCFALWKLVTTVRSYMAVTEKYLTFIILWIYSQQGALSCFMRVILQLSQCLALVYTEFLSIYVVSRYVTHVKADILIPGSSTFEWRVNLEMYTMQIFVFFFFSHLMILILWQGQFQHGYMFIGFGQFDWLTWLISVFKQHINLFNYP